MIRRKDFLKIEYWNLNFNIRSQHNLKRLIEFYKSIILLGHRDLECIEYHHMIPNCINYHNIIDSENLIAMSPREHFIAHMILNRVFEGREDIQMAYAFHRMCYSLNNGRTYKINAQVYESLRIKFSKYILPLQNTLYKSGTCWINDGVKNYQVPKSELDNYLNCGFNKGMLKKKSNKFWINNGEVEKYSDSIPNGWVKGRLDSISSKISERRIKRFQENSLTVANKGKIAVNDGLRNHYINESELKSYLDNGYLLGCLSHCNGSVGKIWVNNGINNKYINPDDLQQFIENGWRKGFIRIN